tara:strand:+ start:1116 stop:2828 length:1713 start_codon:yes stop_codon:yes gene_type:complete
MVTASLEYGPLITGLGGGLALFLYGMRKMTESLKVVAGARLKSMLARLTTNRFTGALAGAGVTAVIQSSSVTTVLVVGFITSGLLTLSQSVGIIIGANIGTTITAQIIAFKVTKYALILIAGGFACEMLARRERIQFYGSAIMGLGLLFFGMNLMSDAANPLRSYEPFMAVMRQMSTPVLGILIGAVFTALVQSSSATTGIVIVMASQGILSLEAGIALLFGANVGTCVTAIIAGIGQPREALQAAVLHVIFNVIGVALWCAFIPQFADFVRLFSPTATGAQGAARLAFETPRQIANAHTLFNIGNALIFIGFTKPLARLVQKIVPPKKNVSEAAGEPVYLDDYYLGDPATALDRVRLEIGRLGGIVIESVEGSFDAVTKGLPGEVTSLHDDERTVDSLHASIVTYLGRLSQSKLVETQIRHIYLDIAAANHWENASDIVGISLARSGRKRLSTQLQISVETLETLRPIHAAVLEVGKMALESFVRSDGDLAKKVIKSKREIIKLGETAQTHLVTRLAAKEPERSRAFRIENDIIEDYKRLHTLFRRIARNVVERASLESEMANVSRTAS